MTWIIIFFWKKRFFRDKLNAVLTLFPQGPNMKQLFWEKKRQIFFGTIRMHFDNAPQNFRPVLWKFYKPVERFSTTAEKIPPNVGRWMKIYNLFRSNNDPRNVTLDILHFVNLDNFVKIFHNRATWAPRMK